MKKSLQLWLDIEDRLRLDEIAIAEQKKFGYPKKRRVEAIASDVCLLGMKEFIKVHNLNSIEDD